MIKSSAALNEQTHWVTAGSNSITHSKKITKIKIAFDQENQWAAVLVQQWVSILYISACIRKITSPYCRQPAGALQCQGRFSFHVKINLNI